MAQVAAGTVVAGRYVLERCIGVGSAGSRWRAQDLESGSVCALRLPDRSSVPPADLSSQYRREADISGKIQCDHVVRVLGFGDWNNRPYLVIEHVDGEDLASHLRRRGKMEPKVAYAIVSQVALALSRAHAVGVVHGDLKPEHILLFADGHRLLVKVFDFGVADATFQAFGGKVTALGLPSYSSPEHLSRKSPDGRSDLWSLGIITYECLTGRRPFRSHSYGELVKLIRGDSVPALEVAEIEDPSELGCWWATACARDPGQRFQSAKAMIDGLAQALGLPPVQMLESSWVLDRSSVPAPAGVSEPPREAVPSTPRKAVSEPPRPSKAARADPVRAASGRRSALRGTRIGLGEQVMALIETRDASAPSEAPPAVESPSAGPALWEAPSAAPVASDARPTAVAPNARWPGAFRATRLGIGDDIPELIAERDRARRSGNRASAAQAANESIAEQAVEAPPAAQPGDESISHEAVTQPPPAAVSHDTLDGLGEAPEIQAVDSSAPPGWEEGPSESFEAEEESGPSLDPEVVRAQLLRRRKLRTGVAVFFGCLVALAVGVGISRLVPRASTHSSERPRVAAASKRPRATPDRPASTVTPAPATPATAEPSGPEVVVNNSPLGDEANGEADASAPEAAAKTLVVEQAQTAPDSAAQAPEAVPQPPPRAAAFREPTATRKSRRKAAPEPKASAADPPAPAPVRVERSESAAEPDYGI